jgi:EAL domain-containing protein (putative c-di-GMP-specific phosphodiesterase class I)
MSTPPILVAFVSAGAMPELLQMTGDQADFGLKGATNLTQILQAMLSPVDYARVEAALTASAAAEFEVLRTKGGTLGLSLTPVDPASGIRGLVMRALSHQPAPHRLDRAALSSAIEAREFSPWFQPIHQINDRQSICGFEALARWHGGNHDRLGPEDFIPAIRGAGLMGQFGAHIRADAVQRFAAIAASKGLTLSVNIAAADLIGGAIVHEVAGLLRDHEFAPHALRLEITESEAIGDTALVQEVMRDLKALDVSLALDDFGSGWSSLTWLERFPVDVVKIDRHFLLQHEVSEASRKIVASVITLAHDLGMQVIAEGVETEATFTWLKGLGCDMAQGFWMSLPMPVDQIAAILE